jgi:hypothetical protein
MGRVQTAVRAGNRAGPIETTRRDSEQSPSGNTGSARWRE